MFIRDNLTVRKCIVVPVFAYWVQKCIGQLGKLSQLYSNILVRLHAVVDISNLRYSGQHRIKCYCNTFHLLIKYQMATQ